MLICKYILWLIFYSIVGWVYETTLCSVEERKFVNRGFLNGPYCPIYGFGAILDILLIGWIDNPFALFFVGMLVTCTLEYFTSYLLEVLFHAKWWDYSYMKFNIKGRVCLLGAIIFGTFSVVLIKFIHPFVIRQTSRLSDNAILIVTILLVLLILTDIVYTLVRFTGFQQKLRELHHYFENISIDTQGYMEKTLSRIESRIESQIEDNDTITQIKERIKSVMMKTNNQEKRMLRAFPRFRHLRYNDVLVRFKEYIKQQGGGEDK